LTEEFKAVGFYLSGHPLDDYMTPLKRKWARDAGVPFMTLDELTDKVADRGAMNARLAGVVAGRQERKSARGNRFAFAQMSDPTGGYEVTLFSDTLEAARDHLEVGSKVVITVEATMETDQLKLLGRSVAPIDLAVADAGGVGLRVFIDTAQAIAAVADVLAGARPAANGGGRGPVQLCLMDPGLPGEVEVDLGVEFPVTPQIKGAIRSLGGVLEVEEI
jgi:DNA polymerase-3 subunit alpha